MKGEIIGLMNTSIISLGNRKSPKTHIAKPTVTLSVDSQDTTGQCFKGNMQPTCRAFAFKLHVDVFFPLPLPLPDDEHPNATPQHPSYKILSTLLVMIV